MPGNEAKFLDMSASSRIVLLSRENSRRRVYFEASGLSVGGPCDSSVESVRDFAGSLQLIALIMGSLR